MAKSKKAKELKVSGFPYSPDKKDIKRRSVELSEGVTIDFVWIPAGNFVMGSNDGLSDHQPAHKASIKDGFWMAETEITNAQYAVLAPDHNSRYVDQMWKDHTTNGIPANEPQQPVIRVSYNDIQEFCSKFEDKTGVKVTIQTDSKSYKANPFGLYSMYGNVAEWSRSLYRSYATGEQIGDEERYVVRGGSYFDPSKRSTAYTRRAYYPHQRVFNVGFRLIIEE